MKAVFTKSLLVCFLITSVLSTSCTLTPPSEHAASATEMRHHNWWNYYDVGCLQMKKGDYDGAAESFEKALGERPGARFGFAEEHWRVRTYGMHFVENYFPVRELGVCRLRQGRMQEAEQLLQQSLDGTPSSRARYQLNHARRATLTGKTADPPRITLSQTGGIITNKREVDLQGRVLSTGYCSALSVNNQPTLIELAEVEVDFHRTFQLKEGDNHATIRAMDLLGQVTELNVKVVADWKAPYYVIHNMEAEGAGWRVTIEAADNVNLQSFRVAGRELITATTMRSGAHQVDLQGDTLIELTDSAGNVLREMLNPAGLFRSLSASRHVLYFGDAGSDTATDARPEVSAAAASDHLPPTVDCSAAARVLVSARDQVFVDGRAQDGGGLARIILQGEDLLHPEDVGAKYGYFGRKLALQEGTNSFTLTVQDEEGNGATETITVLYQPPEFMDAEMRLHVTLPPPHDPEGLGGPAVQAYRHLESALLDDPARFHLLERGEGWDLILQEQELSMSELADPRAALAIRKIVPAQLLFLVSLVSHDDGLTVVAKAVDTETAEIQFVGDVFVHKGIHDLGRQAENLALKIEQRFPLLTGEIADVKGSKIIVDLGADHGVALGTRFLVLKLPPGEEDLFMADTIRSGTDLVEVVANRVFARRSIATVRPGQGLAELQPGDKLFAR